MLDIGFMCRWGVANSAGDGGGGGWTESLFAKAGSLRIVAVTVGSHRATPVRKSILRKRGVCMSANTCVPCRERLTFATWSWRGRSGHFLPLETYGMRCIGTDTSMFLQIISPKILAALSFFGFFSMIVVCFTQKTKRDRERRKLVYCRIQDAKPDY